MRSRSRSPVCDPEQSDWIGDGHNVTNGEERGGDRDPGRPYHRYIGWVGKSLRRRTIGFRKARGHINASLFNGDYLLLWRLDRIPFPLFCFVIACNLLRGTPTPRYVQMLLLLGIVTQPIYALALPWEGANVLFTLAAGVCVTEVLRQQGARTQHIIFAIGVAVTFAFPRLTKTGWEFGIDGVLFPAAILLVLAGRREHIVWLSALVIGQNWYGEISPGEPWVLDALIDAAYASIGSLVILSIALLLRNHDRFLPRYAFQIFYPGHLAVLAVLAVLWQVHVIHSH